MSTVNVFQAKSTLSKLIERVETGKDEEIVIARHGRPVVRLTRLAVARPEKRIGVAKGLFTVPDSIDADNARKTLDARSLNSCTFRPGNVLMGYALPEATSAAAVHR